MRTLNTLPLVLAIAASALGSPLPAAPDSPEPDERLTYKEVDGDDLELHLFKPDGWKAEDRRPAIVFFFGGGWVGGHPKQFYPQSEHLAAKGMVAISAQYRTKGSHATTPFDCVEDGKSAIRYVRAHAAELGVDPDKIVAGGGSAGGHVAASTGTVSGFEVGDTAVSSRPVAMVLFNPVCDTSPKGFGKKRLGERWRELSPLHHISGKTPPTCIFHGEADTTVPHKNAVDFRDAMKRAGSRCVLHSFPGEKHGFFNRGDPYTETVAKMDTFLASLGYIEEAESTTEE